MEIQNNKECFVQLWLGLERTRQHLEAQYKRFCTRHLLKSWFGHDATDDFIWEVCNLATISSPNDEPYYGYDILPPPSLYPRRHRELLRAIVAVCLGIGLRKVNIKELDAAYSIAFPKGVSIRYNNKNKKL
jgi:hypothetical protein